MLPPARMFLRKEKRLSWKGYLLVLVELSLHTRVERHLVSDI